jgi:SAM-dependent methyltransferase
MPDSARERYRRAASGKPDHRGRGRRTGHAAMFRLDQVVELGDFAEGGGFPSRFLRDLAYPTLGVTDPAKVLHICSGSVRAPFTVDRRIAVRPAVVADARALPFRPGAFDWVIADPPYSREWARRLYKISARQYPTPGGIVAEALGVLRPGGRLGLLHYMVPPYSTASARLVGVWGVTIGPGSTIRAWSVLEKLAELPLLSGPPYGGPAYGGQVAEEVPGRPRLQVLDELGDVVDPVRDRAPAPAGLELGAVTELCTAGRTETSPAGVSSRPCGCGCGELVAQPRTGRPRLYVGPAHRQRAYRRRLD